MKLLPLVAATVTLAGSARGQGRVPYPLGDIGRPEASPWAEPIARARDQLQANMKEFGVPGASVVVVKEGLVVWSEALGYADVEQKIRATKSTRFRIYSVSKALTSVALGLLVQDGKLDLDRPVQEYVPVFPLKQYPVTTRQLAGHMGGIRGYAGTEYLNQRPFRSVAEGLAIFDRDSLVFRPGDQYLYTSYGFTLISAVIEGASGEPYLSFMRHRVFEPLGMKHTVPDRADTIIPSRARWYTRDSLEQTVLAQYVDNSYKWAGAGFLSTAEDLAFFGVAMFGRRLLESRTVQQLWTSQRTADGRETGYGIGWRTGLDTGGRRIVGHDGGSSALLLIYPLEKFVFAFVSNSDQPQPVFDEEIRELFLRGALRSTSQ